MQKVISVVGHKNPDTDSICSAIGYSELKNLLGFNCEPKRCGDISPETQFVLDRFKIDEPKMINSAKDESIILVDHNEVGQAVDDLNEGVILDIIDHHKIGGITTSEPIYFRNMPVGATASIVYLMYKENGLTPSKEVAGLLCSAILSDTLAFRSPTCTSVDKENAIALANIAQIANVEEYALEMFKAGSNLAEKTDKEIFNLDFKKFTSGNTTFGVGQVTSMSGEELEVIAERLNKYVPASFAEHEADMLFFMLTDILNESSKILCFGDNALETAYKAFEVSDGNLNLAGVMSRKKQVVPQLTETLK